MMKTELKRMIRTNFDPILAPHGFSCGGKTNVIYWRKLSTSIVHVIVVAAMQQNTRYQILVFGTSPVVEDEFETRFPNDLHIVNAPKCYLSPEDGVSDYQKLYFCGNPDAFMTSFKRDAAPALVNSAIPYLDKIQTIENLIPTIRLGGMMGAALLQVGRTSEAKQLIENEIKRLSKLPLDRYGQVERALAFQSDLLAKI
ncbi:hypothetical protein ACWKWJ_07825 [Sphingopyxis terrae subsp. ummariensis]